MNHEIGIPSTYGVYFLILRNKIVYIGGSQNLKRRIKNHFGTKKKIPTFDFNEVSWIVSDKDNFRQIERYYIKKYKPIHNKHVHFDGYKISL